MENTITNNVVLEKKMDCYNNNNLDNFTAPQELTVTITLHEYRKLVEEVATKKQDIDKANQDKYERDCENRKLKEEVAKLKEETVLYICRREASQKEAKRLLKIVMDDMNSNNFCCKFDSCKVCSKRYSISCNKKFQWHYSDEALKLLVVK